MNLLLWVNVAKSSISATVRRAVWGWVDLRGRGQSSESLARHDQLLQFGNGDPLGWVHLEDPVENSIQFRAQWKNGFEEIAVPHVGPKSRIFIAGPFPWIAAASKIYKNDT